MGGLQAAHIFFGHWKSAVKAALIKASQAILSGME